MYLTMTKKYIPCPPWTQEDVFLKHQRIHSNYNSDLSINNKAASENKIDFIIEIINNGVILSYDTILTFAKEGNIEDREKLLEIKKKNRKIMFPMNEKLFIHACMRYQKLIKFLQDKKCLKMNMP